MKVTFRCKRSGNTVSFTSQIDIDSLRSHEGYEELKEEITNEKDSSSTNAKNANADANGKEDYKEKEVLIPISVVKDVKKLGRPAKH